MIEIKANLALIRQKSQRDKNCRAILPQSVGTLTTLRPKDGLETTMDATRPTEQSQDSQRHYRNLDDRYGKIGISAVAAAVRHQGEQRNVSDTRFLPNDSD